MNARRFSIQSMRHFDIQPADMEGCIWYQPWIWSGKPYVGNDDGCMAIYIFQVASGWD